MRFSRTAATALVIALATVVQAHAGGKSIKGVFCGLWVILRVTYNRICKACGVQSPIS